MAALLVSYVLITVGQIISYGRFEPHALVLVTLGCGAGLWAIHTSASAAPSLSRPPLVLCALAVLLSAMVHNPLTYCQRPLWATGYRIGLLVAIGLIITYLFTAHGARFWGRLRFLVLLFIVIAARVAVPFLSPNPGEDVWVVQQEAAVAVLSGVDPYSVSYSQIFAPEVYAAFGYSSGFHYPPITLIPIVAAFRLFGDIRWAYILCELFILWFLWRQASKARWIAGTQDRELILWMWGFNSSVLFILEHSWTEPLGLALLAGFVWLSSRHSVWPAAVCLAAFFSFKQYTLLLFPLLFFLPRCGPLAICFAGITALSYLPWLLTNAQGLIGSLLEPWRAHPRPDGLSFAALWINVRHVRMPEWVSAFFILLGMHIAMNRIVRDNRGLLLALFAVLAPLFITAKQSFCNYYYFLSFLALAGSVMESPVTQGNAWPRARKSGPSTAACDGS